jgi:hypothetical protein
MDQSLKVENELRTIKETIDKELFNKINYRYDVLYEKYGVAKNRASEIMSDRAKINKSRIGLFY